MSENEDFPVSELPDGNLAVITQWDWMYHVGTVVFRRGLDLVSAAENHVWCDLFGRFPVDSFHSARLLRDGERLVYRDGWLVVVEEPCPEDVQPKPPTPLALWEKRKESSLTDKEEKLFLRFVDSQPLIFSETLHMWCCLDNRTGSSSEEALDAWFQEHGTEPMEE